MSPGLGTRIVQARAAAGLSQDALAAQLGLTRAQVRWLERRQTRNLDRATLARLAAVCGVSVAYLEGREPAPSIVGAELGTRIVVARSRAGLSQEALAARLGVSRHTLSRIERGLTTSPGIEEVRKIAAVCGVKLHWLIPETGEAQQGGSSEQAALG